MVTHFGLSPTVVFPTYAATSDVLYHYTGPTGLIGIISDQQIWATNIHYLNDRREFMLARKYASAEARRILPGHSGIESRFLESIANMGENLGANSYVFVFCMSAEKDSLSQWRAYGPQPGGYAVGFTVELLKKVAEDHSFDLVKCIYDSSRARRVLRRFVRESLERFEAELEDIDCTGKTEKELLQDHRAVLFRNLARLAPCFKDPAFQEEQEWRLVSQPIAPTDPGVGFRPGVSFPIPFYRLPIGSSPLPIERVVVGPAPAGDKTWYSTAVESLMKSAGRGNFGVSQSSIPYRAI